MPTRVAQTSGAKIIDPILLTIVTFDVTVTETVSDTADWTDYPVETGLPITDHVVINPVELTLDGVFTDTPLRKDVLPVPDLARQAYERLLDLMHLGQLVVVVTPIRVYTSMGITSVDLVRDESTGQALFPSVSLKEIRIVNSVAVPIPPEILSPPAKAPSQSELDAGKQVASESGDVTEDATDASLAYRVVEGLGGEDVDFADLLRGN